MLISTFLLFNMISIAGGISPPAYKETIPWGSIILVAASIIFVAILFTMHITKHLCNKKNKKDSAVNNLSEESLTDKERMLINEYRKLRANQKDMLIQTIEAWNINNEK